MLLGSFAAPQNGFLGFICGPPWVHLRPPLFETTVFIARNGFFCGVRKPSFLTVFGFFGFFKNAILEVVEVVFCGPNKFSFFACVSGLGSSRRSPRGSGTRNPSKQGVSEQFCVVGPGWFALDPLYRLHVAVHFWRKFFGVSQICFFGSSNFWPNWFWKAKKGLGLQNRGDFQNDVFPILPGQGPICEVFGAFSFLQLRRGLGSIRAVARNLLAAAVRMVFPKFSGVLFSTAFLRIWKGIFWNPLSSFRVFFSAFSSSAWVDATLVCFGAVGPKPFFSFCFFVCLFTKTLFSPWKRVIFVHFSMSHFLSPWFPSLLLFIPCLSLSLVYFFCPSLFFCFFLWPFLFFCCSFLPCFFAFVSWQQQQHQNIRCERFLFINLFCFFWVSCFLVSPIPFSYLCFSLFKFCVLVNMNVFVFLSRPFLKHRFLFCILWNIIVFLGAHFVGKIWMMCKNTVKNRYFSTLLIDQA